MAFKPFVFFIVSRAEIWFEQVFDIVLTYSKALVHYFENELEFI